MQQAMAPQASETMQPAKPEQEAALPPSESASAPAPSLPEFDTVRVEPSGDTIVAGHGEPNAKVALMAGDKVLAEAEADGAGNFVMVPPALAPGGYVLGLRSSGAGGTLDSHQNVTVSVPPKGEKNVVVALAEPGKPSVILSDSNPKPEASAPAAGSSPAQPEVAFKTAEVDNGGFYASGSATPGAHLRIYLNGSALADVTAGTDGHWSLTIGKGMSPGHFAVRADSIDEKGNVVARAEVPFDVPVNVAEAAPAANDSAATAVSPPPPKPAASESASPPPVADAPSQSDAAKETGNENVANATPTPSANDVVVPRIDTATVVRGDSLWRISRKVFGHGIRYTLIYEANAKQIRDPSLIYPGQVFVLPHVDN
jgi:nucleoid-associated protein YgaU